MLKEKCSKGFFGIYSPYHGSEVENSSEKTWKIASRTNENKFVP